VVTELRFLSNTFARINDARTKALDTFWYVIESFTSLGDATRAHVWGESQSCHTADLKISGGTLGQFRVIALVNTVDFGFYDTLSATNIVQKHPDPLHLRDSVAARSPVHRVYYDSKFRKWLPLPQLPNYSLRDRDKGRENVEALAAPVTRALPADEAPVLTTEDRVIAYLQKQGEFVPAHQIKSAIAALKELSAEEVRGVLNRMAETGLIARRMSGVSVLFGVIGT
jgi:hypothetical protein